MSMLEEEELKNVHLLVFANKTDMPGSLTAAEVSTALGLVAIKDRAWHIQKSCGTTGEGLKEGLDWLSSTFGVTK